MSIKRLLPRGLQHPQINVCVVRVPRQSHAQVHRQIGDQAWVEGRSGYLCCGTFSIGIQRIRSSPEAVEFGEGNEIDVAFPVVFLWGGLV